MIHEIHDIIRQDLIENQKDLFNLYNYYTHKYRSNDRLLDINVGLFFDNSQRPVAQIYVADKNTRIREQLIMNHDYKIIDNDLKIKTYENN